MGAKTKVFIILFSVYLVKFKGLKTYKKKTYILGSIPPQWGQNLTEH